MNKTRKAIIDLIEPYMDKTLSEWCLIKTKHKEYDKITVKRNNLLYFWLENPIPSNWIEIIIWHYDITAVENFLDMLWYTFFIHNQLMWIIKDNKTIWIIPNKPLHLYTEQEEKDLLELLTKLNNN